jgi:two-component system, OmpR family, response regulator TctD
MRILLVEDHVELSRWVARALEKSRYTVERSLNGADADARLATETYDLVLLDLSLARMDGLEVLRRLRARGSRTPVLVVTARTEVSDRVRGLDLGADDYLAKPFEIDELEARIRALLRRTQAGGETRPACANLVLDPAAHAFEVDGKLLNLTPREFAVLESLLLRAGKVVAKDQLHARLFSLESEARADAIEVYVHRLRRKLAGARVRIVTLRGLGYLLEEVTP